MKGEPLIILLVEDNPAHAKIIIRNLRNHRIANTIRHVSDGEAALDYLHRRNRYEDPQKSPRPHVVLLDLRLPRIDGLEVLREIKTDRELHRIPVVVLTTSQADRDMARAYDYNANAYLTKPVDYEEFKNLMDDFGFFWLCWNNSTISSERE